MKAALALSVLLSLNFSASAETLERSTLDQKMAFANNAIEAELQKIGLKMIPNSTVVRRSKENIALNGLITFVTAMDTTACDTIKVSYVSYEATDLNERHRYKGWVYLTLDFCPTADRELAERARQKGLLFSDPQDAQILFSMNLGWGNADTVITPSDLHLVLY